MFYPNGDRISYDYNHQGEIVQLNSYYQTILQSRVFDQNGRVIEQKFGNGSTTHYEYETWTGAAGAIKKIQSGLSLNSNDVSLQNLSYAYDLVGNITKIDDDGEILNFTYDALNRLMSVSGAYAESYDYDPNTGNLLRKAGIREYYYSSGKPHAVTGYEGKDHLFEYDANGQMIKRHGQNIRYDAQGNLVSYLGKTYFYDGDGKRVAMVHPDGKTTIYIGNYYETVWIPIDDIGPVTPPVFMNSEQNNYSYFPFVGNGEGPNFETVPGKSYYYAGSSRIAMKTENYETIWIYGDHLGSTSVTADRYGEELSRTKYHAWGTTRYSTGMQATDYGYTGQMQVDDIYYYNARWYDPAIGRFMQADTIVPSHQGTQGFDRYAYVNNNPLKYVDSSGHVIELAKPIRDDFETQEEYEEALDNFLILESEYYKALDYLYESPTAKELIEKIDNADEIYLVMLNSAGDTTFYQPYRVINFDPKSGLILTGGSIQSPALGFAHELGHVSQDLDGKYLYLDIKQLEIENLTLESTIARELGEPTRKFYIKDTVGPMKMKHSTDRFIEGYIGPGFSTQSIY